MVRGIPESVMERLLKKIGADRVSDDAKGALAELLEDYGESIGKRALQFAKHAGRKTIKAKDVKLASKQ